MTEREPAEGSADPRLPVHFGAAIDLAEGSLCRSIRIGKLRGYRGRDWSEFLALHRSGDDIRRFDTSSVSAGFRSGVKGIAILRNGTVVATWTERVSD